MKTNQSFSLLFWLYKGKLRNGIAPIYCRITVNGRRSQFSVQRGIEPEKWDSRSGSAKGSSIQAKTLNAYLDLIKGELHKHYNHLLSTGKVITADAVKKSYQGISDQKSLIEAFEYHNELFNQRVGIDVSEATYKKFSTVLKKVKAYLKHQYKRQDILLLELNHQFVEGFEIYLKTKQKLGHNSAIKYIQSLKTVINLAVRNEWMSKNPFSNFKASLKQVKREVLTAGELQALMNKEFSIERIREVRDVFVFCCYTGYAFIDVKSLKPDNILIGIDGEKWIHTSRQKTNQQSNVPLLPAALQILEKYSEHDYCKINGVLLPVRSNQKMNAYLKEIADLCGIKKNLTMHIARHTFATTITLANGVPIESVSSMLGHNSIRTTQIYAKVVERKVSEDMNALKAKLTGLSDTDSIKTG